MKHPLLRFAEAHPFVRLVLPLMAGIAMADRGEGFTLIPYIYVLVVLTLIGMLMFIVHQIHSWDRPIREPTMHSPSRWSMTGLTIRAC